MKYVDDAKDLRANLDTMKKPYSMILIKPRLKEKLIIIENKVKKRY